MSDFSREETNICMNIPTARESSMSDVCEVLSIGGELGHIVYTAHVRYVLYHAYIEELG